jgi:hypothetical protein
MRHTIVIELPDGVDPNEVERKLTSRLEGKLLATGVFDGTTTYGHARVIEYHYEQMTTTEENP